MDEGAFCLIICICAYYECRVINTCQNMGIGFSQVGATGEYELSHMWVSEVEPE